MARRKQKQFLSQAALEALVRYSPELSGLMELQRTAATTRKGAVRQARAQAHGTQAAVASSIPTLAAIYDAAGLTQANLTGTLVGHDLQGLTGDVGKLFQAAGALDAAGAGSRLNAGKTQALTDLVNRGVAAQEGSGYAIRAASDKYASDLSQIQTRRQTVKREKGAYEAEVIGELQGEAAKRHFQAREAAKDRRTRRQIAEGNNDTTLTVARGHDATSLANATTRANASRRGTLPGGVKLATPQQHGTAHDAIYSALAQARQLNSADRSRAEVMQTLLVGRPAITLTTHPNGEKLKTPAHVPGIRATKPLYAKVALDLLYKGYVSPGSIKQLHRRGLSVKELGLPLPKQGKGAQGAAPVAPFQGSARPT